MLHFENEFFGTSQISDERTPTGDIRITEFVLHFEMHKMCNPECWRRISLLQYRRKDVILFMYIPKISHCTFIKIIFGSPSFSVRDYLVYFRIRFSCDNDTNASIDFTIIQYLIHRDEVKWEKDIKEKTWRNTPSRWS